MAFENIVGKGENVDNQYFHVFPQCFLPNQGQIFSFQEPHLFFYLSSAHAFSLDISKLCLLVKVLIGHCSYKELVEETFDMSHLSWVIGLYFTYFLFKFLNEAGPIIQYTCM